VIQGGDGHPKLENLPEHFSPLFHRGSPSFFFCGISGALVRWCDIPRNRGPRGGVNDGRFERSGVFRLHQCGSFRWRSWLTYEVPLATSLTGRITSAWELKLDTHHVSAMGLNFDRKES
jgi:hypothetical protein